MKRVLLFLMAVTLSVAAQQSPAPAASSTSIGERVQKPSYSDLQCAGFLRQAPLSHKEFVAAGIYSPHTSRYAEGDDIFIEGGGLQEGAALSLVRELKDPNRREAFQGQDVAIKAAGQPYADLGRAHVVAIRGNVAVAHIDFSCEGVAPGDLAIPYEERAMPSVPATVSLEQFPAATSGANTGRIVLAKDFDTVLGTGHKIYLNLGSDKGVHPGDTFRILRSYNPAGMPAVDKLSYEANVSEDTQRRQMKIGKRELAELPARTVGQAVVLLTSPGSSTAIITVALEDVMVGDRVELIPATTASMK
jgi:hypothetical protein